MRVFQWGGERVVQHGARSGDQEAPKRPNGVFEGGLAEAVQGSVTLVEVHGDQVFE